MCIVFRGLNGTIEADPTSIQTDLELILSDKES